jgi:hypothetical protein
MIETPESGSATSLNDKAPAPSPAPPPAAAKPAGQPPAAPAPASSGRAARRALIMTAVSGAVAVAAAAAAAVLLTQHAHRAEPLRATVFTLRPGQCFDSLPNGIAGAHVVPCAHPHDAEIYGTFRVAGHRWPGTAALGAQARLGCQRRLSSYLNPQLATSGLAESYAYPNQDAWTAGERTVICEIRGTHGTLTGSVRASGP